MFYINKSCRWFFSPVRWFRSGYLQACFPRRPCRSARADFRSLAASGSAGCGPAIIRSRPEVTQYEEAESIERLLLLNVLLWIETDTRLASPLSFVYWFGLENSVIFTNKILTNSSISLSPRSSLSNFLSWANDSGKLRIRFSRSSSEVKLDKLKGNGFGSVYFDIRGKLVGGGQRYASRATLKRASRVQSTAKEQMCTSNIYRRQCDQ